MTPRVSRSPSSGYTYLARLIHSTDCFTVFHGLNPRVGLYSLNCATFYPRSRSCEIVSLTTPIALKFDRPLSSIADALQLGE